MVAWSSASVIRVCCLVLHRESESRASLGVTLAGVVL